MTPRTRRWLASVAAFATAFVAGTLACGPAVAESEVATAGADGAALENFSTLDGWKVWAEAWGGKASFRQADSAPPGAPGAIQGKFPGIVYKELSAEQQRQAAVGKEPAGLSFWVKGDGSDDYGCLAIGPAGEKSWTQGFGVSAAYACYFPLKDAAWHKVTVGWDQFVAEETQPAIGAPGGLAPSDIRVLRLGNRWAWKHHPEEPSPGRDYAVAMIRFEPEAPVRKPAPPLADISGVLAKFEHKQPVRIRVLGDSITAGHSVDIPAGERYSDRVGRLLREAFGYEGIVVENRGVCAARISDARGWVERDFAGEPPDLAMMMYGTNDSVACKPAEFERMLEDYLDRVAVATGGRTAVLLLTTIPGGLDRYASADPFAAVIREVATRRHLAYCDLQIPFKELGADRVKMMMVTANVHPNAEGHALMARTIVDFLSQEMPPDFAGQPPEKLLAVSLDPATVRSHRLLAARALCRAKPDTAAIAGLLGADDKIIQMIAIDSLAAPAEIEPQLATLIRLAGAQGKGGFLAGPIAAAIDRAGAESVRDLAACAEQNPGLVGNYLSLLFCVSNPEAARMLAAIVGDASKPLGLRQAASSWLVWRQDVTAAEKNAALDFLLPMLSDRANGKRAGSAAILANGFCAKHGLWFEDPRVREAAVVAAADERAQPQPDPALLAPLDKILAHAPSGR